MDLKKVFSERQGGYVSIIEVSPSRSCIFIAGDKSVVGDVLPVLEQPGIPVYHVPGCLGSASKMRHVNNLLLGLHTAAAAEAMGLAARAGLHTSQVYEIIAKAAGNSVAFETRAKRMLGGEWAPETRLSTTAANQVRNHDQL